MSDTKSSSSVGFLGLLTILFIGLKLAHFISWSWWWVLSPLWVPVAAIVAFVGVCLVLWLIQQVL